MEQRSSRDFQRLLIESYRVDEFDVLLEGSASHQQHLVNLVTDSWTFQHFRAFSIFSMGQEWTAASYYTIGGTSRAVCLAQLYA